MKTHQIVSMAFSIKTTNQPDEKSGNHQWSKCCCDISVWIKPTGVVTSEARLLARLESLRHSFLCVQNGHRINSTLICVHYTFSESIKAPPSAIKLLFITFLFHYFKANNFHSSMFLLCCRTQAAFRHGLKSGHIPEMGLYVRFQMSESVAPNIFHVKYQLGTTTRFESIRR